MPLDPTTSVSLLLRLRESSVSDTNEAWERFAAMYLPLIAVLIRKYNSQLPLPLQDADLQDIVQQVFLNLRKRLTSFEPDPKLRFRGYLSQTTRNVFLNGLKKRSKQLDFAELEEHCASVEADSILNDEQEHTSYLYQRCIDQMKSRLSEKHWEICHRYFEKSQSAAEIADSMGVAQSLVYTVVSRTKKMIRAELDGLLDE